MISHYFYLVKYKLRAFDCGMEKQDGNIEC